MSFYHRSDVVFVNDANGDPDWGASYTVTVYPVGAVASAGSAAKVATVDAGHSFSIGDKVGVWDGSTFTFVAEALTGVAQTTLTWTTTNVAISAGDNLVNLGPDTSSTGTANFDGSRVFIYSDADGSTKVSNAKVTADSTLGSYDYYYRGDGAVWEVIRDSTGTVQSVVTGYDSAGGRRNVADYGAALDGVEDDALAINPAILAGNNNVVYVPAGGNALIKSNIPITQNDLILEGPGTITASAADLGDGGKMITVTGTNVTIRDITLDQNTTSTGRTIEIGAATNTKIQNVVSKNVQQAFVWGNGAFTDLYVEGCEHNAKGYFVLINDTNGATGLFVTHNMAQHDGSGTAIGDGVQINCPTNGFSRFRITDNLFRDYFGNASNAGQGVGCDTASDGVISHNVIDNSEADGIHVEDSNQVIVTDNIVTNCGVVSDTSGSGAIVVFNSDRCTVRGNVIETTTELHGIFLAGDLSGTDQNTDNVVMGNIIKDVDDAGIAVHAQVRAQICNNNINAPDSETPGDWAGIDVRRLGTSTADCDGLRIIGNTVIDKAAVNAKYGIEVAAGTTNSVISQNDVSGCTNTIEVNGAAIRVFENDGFAVPTITNADATPSVAGWTVFKTTGATAITDFDDGYVGQIITILCGADITITDNANIILAGGVNYTMTTTDTLTLCMFNTGVWSEIGRSVN